MRTPRTWLTLTAVGLALALTAAAPAVAEPSPTPTATPAASPAREPAPTTAEPTATPTVTPDPTPPQTATATPTAGPTPTAEPTATPTATPQADTEIDRRYAELGGPNSFLGNPTSGEYDIAGGRAREYQHGLLYWTAATGVTAVTGGIRSHYGSLGRHGGRLGVPLADEQRLSSGIWKQRFAGGDIYFITGRGARVTWGGIGDGYRARGAEGGRLGLPVTDEKPVVRGAWVQDFEHGLIYWSPEYGVQVVQGAMLTKYATVGWDGGRLGLPTGGEFRTQWGQWVQNFAGGAIYYRDGLGTHTSWGALRIEYARHNWELGDLGGPISDEFWEDNSWKQDFEHGQLIYAGGFRTRPWTRATVRNATSADVVYTYRAGCPVGPDQLRVVEMNHLGYDGWIKRGLMVVRWDTTNKVIAAFDNANRASFPVYKMVNIDVYRGDDPTSMAENNSSAFNCRSVVGNPYRMSPHSYGRAVDINTVQNPYFDGSRWWPANGVRYTNRSLNEPGMFTGSDAMSRGMINQGFFWGGWWASKDYHHFEIQ